VFIRKAATVFLENDKDLKEEQVKLRSKDVAVQVDNCIDPRLHC